MTEHFKFVGVVRDGKAPHGEAIRETMKVFEGKEVEITIAEPKKTRTNQQNRYYWGPVLDAVIAFDKEQGGDMDKEQAHEHLMVEVGGFYKIKKQYLVWKKVRKSSTTLTTKEWGEYMEKIKAWAAAFGLIIPDPVLLGYGADGDLRGKDAANS